MSGVVKTVKKVFKKVIKVIKKIAVPVLIAAAVYFTAGLALSAFAPTSAFAASMPGFAGGGFLGTGIGAGATAGTGVFSQAATAIGLGGGLQAGAGAIEAASAAQAALVANSAAGIAPLTAANAVTAPATLGSVVGGIGSAAGNAVSNLASGFGAMSFSDKLLMTKVGTDVAGALFGPTPAEEAEALAIENAKFRGAFYGQEGDGSGAPAGGAPAPQVNAPQPPSVGQSQQQQVVPPQKELQPTSISPEQQNLLDGRGKKELFPKAAQTQVGQTTGPGAMQSNIPIPENISATMPGVRYV